MYPSRLALLSAALLALPACEPTSAPPADSSPTPAPPSTAAPPPATTPSAPTTSSTGEARTPGAAADVVRAYYAAIDAGDYRRAYDMWEDGGQASGKSYDAFARGFAATAAVSADVGEPSDGEGAAGSVYVSVPVTVHARTASGTTQTFGGTYVLRRVSDVEGATPEQRRWHLSSADLTAAP